MSGPPGHGPRALPRSRGRPGRAAGWRASGPGTRRAGPVTGRKRRHGSAPALLRELRRDKVRIHTSVISVQEASVVAYRRGTVPRDYHGKIGHLADIHTIDKSIAVTAAKHEASLIEHLKPEEQNKPRRKWDCFHIAAAQQNNCSVLYTTDKRLLNRQKQLGIVDVKFSLPVPTGTLQLDFSAKPASQTAAPSQ